MKPTKAKKTDGRELRSSRSHQLIVDTLYTLIGSGETQVSAAQLAEAANLSIRTVFRQFEEVDLVYNEINRRVAQQITPQLEAPFVSADWLERLVEYIDRLEKVYEYATPYRIANDARRFRSPPLMAGHQQWVIVKRESLQQCLAGAIKTNSLLFQALEAATSFETWLRLRREQGLSSIKTQAVMLFSVKQLTADH